MPTTSPPPSTRPSLVAVPVQRPEPDKPRTLQGRFHAAASQSRDRNELIVRLARQLVDATKADVIVVARGAVPTQLTLDGVLHPVDGLPEEMKSSFLDSAKAALQEGLTRVGRIGRPPNQLLISVPVSTASGAEVLQALFLAPVATPDVLTTVVELAVATLAQFDLRAQAAELNDESLQLAAITDLAARIESCPSLRTAGQTVCDDAATHTGAMQMAVGLLPTHSPHCRVLASSRLDGPAASDRRDTLLEAALNEAILRKEAGIWPPPPNGVRHSLATHKQLALHSQGEAVVSVPLRTHQGEVVGAWLAILKDSESASQIAKFMLAAAPSVGAALLACQRGEKGAFASGINGILSSLKQRKGRWVTCIAVILLASMWIPVPYSVRSSCEVHPVSLRYVAAPFDARLLRAEVEPGDEVEEGQLLARLDGEEIRVELSGATAEVDRAAKERDGHLADKEINAAQVARLDMARMDAKASLLRQRSEQLEIRSPVTGVVISGDLRRAEGVPLTTGQTMFEIAPLEEMVLEIGIPEEDIHHIQVGQSVEAVLNALPDRTWTGTIERIHPRSELIDQDYVFIVETHFTNEHGLLRPGMKGRAKVATARHPLGWNLFHKAVDQARFWAGW